MVWLKSFKGKISTLGRLSPAEWALLGQALAIFPIVSVSLLLGGMKRTQSFLSSLVPISRLEPNVEVQEILWKTSRIVQLASRFNFFWASCLRRSLVLWFLLRRQGIESQLRIGVKREEGQFAAHAWVEWNNIPINDSLTVRQEFTMFDHL